MSRTLESATYKRLIRQLKTARLDQGETQTSLAAKLKRPQSFITKTERLDRRLDVLEFIRWCDALGIDPASLMSRASKSSAPRK